MKILYLLDFLPFIEDENGLSKIFYNLLKNIPKNIEHDLLIVSNLEIKVNEYFFNVAKISYEITVQSKKRILFNRLRCIPTTSLPKTKITDLFERYKMNQYDIIHCSHLSFFYLSALHPNVIIGVNDSLSLSLPKSKGLKVILKKTYNKRLDAVLADSGAWLTLVSERDASAFNTNKKIVFANGVDTNKYRPYYKYDEKIPQTCVFHGVLDFEPNIRAIKKMSIFLKKALPNYKLFLVGRFTRGNEKKMKSTYEELGNCVFIGEVDEIAKEITKYQFYLALLDSGTGIKNKILEAMSCGCLVLANSKALNGVEPRSELSEVMYKVDNHADLNKVLSDRKNWETKCKRAREYMIAYHSWENYTKKVVTFYQKVLNEE